MFPVQQGWTEDLSGATPGISFFEISSCPVRRCASRRFAPERREGSEVGCHLLNRDVQARWLALSLHSGAWTRDAIADRIARVLPAGVLDSKQLSARICFHFDQRIPPEVETLVSYLLQEPLLKSVFRAEQIRGPLLDSPVMAPQPDNLVTFPLPQLPTCRDLGLWLCLFDKEVEWFSDCRAQQGKVTEERLHHYRYAWMTKKTGGFRLIEKPKSRLKLIQRTILRDILNRVPPHPCAHGFTRGRSIKSFAAPHVGQQAVLHLDLKDFFHSVPIGRISATFRRLGYPRKVARLLQGLCTNSVSPHLAGNHFAHLPWRDRKRLLGKHLPQGSPASGALANLCSWHLDCRLKGLADHFGYQYSRYADDLAFSGPMSLARRIDFIESLVGSIALDEGYSLNHRKTRLRLASQRQRVAGVVVNAKANYYRADWDRLKAILYNCAKHGPASQDHDNHPDFKAYLEGCVAHVEFLNRSRGEKLRLLLDQIIW